MASEEITNETAEQPVEATARCSRCWKLRSPLHLLLKKPRSTNPARISSRNSAWAVMTISPKS